MKEKATLAGGCYWCTEAVFKNIEGVESIRSGFIGGNIKNPSYREVCEGRTGHAEAIEIIYDAEKINYTDVLHVFFGTHDPTTLNRQGNDIGNQYRSAVFYHSEEQKEIAQKVMDELNDRIFEGKIVTELNPATDFYEAEEAHQNFYYRNTEYPYCQAVINPKLRKLRQNFTDKLKKVSN